MTGFWFSHYITQRCLCFPPGKHQINARAANLLALTKRIQKSMVIRTNIIFLITKFMWVLELNVKSKFPWWGPHFFGQVKIWEPIVFLNIGLKLRFQVLKTWVLIDLSIASWYLLFITLLLKLCLECVWAGSTRVASGCFYLEARQVREAEQTHPIWPSRQWIICTWECHICVARYSLTRAFIPQQLAHGWVINNCFVNGWIICRVIFSSPK